MSGYFYADIYRVYDGEVFKSYLSLSSHYHEVEKEKRYHKNGVRKELVYDNLA